ncbi:uncharacterized protein L969DRAFT_91783 [Mixia osmundae IAM 14324]|uniref:CSC1/OSCA1-like 7TM region domain-containing protein n=1 Tax=Mixia osmundae (strain CBS 9802 / IAM 14324 / JCM 22182 / KY 12970) TaxID=764103 RepID=G7EAI2_MIXOS|nr:uncharacterized protein L969DRAFT_91783 [Mixia osmundae IAM 14324]KEI42332.1 hypothetical protein L969DRAFT_91783 [Mixia osmundae IAM 14324]GAA99842.1 hypothetical protein E5Q_06545 [Mixia osmundae IAM 14324]
MDLDPGDGDVPGNPRDRAGQLTGAWLSTQLVLCAFVFVTCFGTFCLLRNKFKVLYAPRTLLRGFTPHEVHDKSLSTDPSTLAALSPTSFLGWILPTLRVSELSVLQLVGLDAAVLLGFFKMAFYFFLLATILAFSILAPINFRENGIIDGVPVDKDGRDKGDESGSKHEPAKPPPPSALYLSTHLAYTYLFTLMLLYMLHRHYRSFVHLRQLFSLDHAHSIPARTVLLSKLPRHLRAEVKLAEYWENMGLAVESVSVGREVGTLADLIHIRTHALLKLESAWAQYAGNPVRPFLGYDRDAEVDKILDTESQPTTSKPPDDRAGYLAPVAPFDARGANGEPHVHDETIPDAQRQPLLPSTDAKVDDLIPTTQDGDALSGEHESASIARSSSKVDDEEAQLRMPPPMFMIPGKKRPTVRPGWFRSKVDALNYYAQLFRDADEAVRDRRAGRFYPTDIAFVTFEKLSDAQVASQVVHYPQPEILRATLAPEPRDIHWGNMALSDNSITVRAIIVNVTTLLLLLFWFIPVGLLASLLNIKTVEKYAPWLAKALAKNVTVQAFVSNTLPTLAIVIFNQTLPYIISALCTFKGLRAKSWIEYSLMKVYFMFLLFTVFFIFLAVQTLSLLVELADKPTKILEKLATSLPGGRNFFISYVMLQGLAIMPLQLVQLSTVVPRWFCRIFLTRTPRDHAELNAPPILNLGQVYPQAILIFIICLNYSIIAPLVLLFGTCYFGMAYLVYKYNFLFVYYKPYESRGQAWPIAFGRLSLGLIIFQLFMTGLFTTREAFEFSVAMAPLILFTLWTTRKIHTLYGPLTKYTNLSQASEMQAGSASDVERLHKGHPVTQGQTTLNRARYAHRDESLYIVGQDHRTDYSQPPMSDVFTGVLNTGRRRYGHPALTGQLPAPWLPCADEPDQPEFQLTRSESIVIDLKQKWSAVKRGTTSLVGGRDTQSARSATPVDDATRAWRESALAESSAASSRGANDVDETDDEDEQEASPAYRTYYPRRRRAEGTETPSRSPVFPPQPTERDEDVTV